jgi:hypothetical protein
MDMFVVPTISFRLLYGLLIMGHGRRHILWFGVTAHPTAEWIANQLTEACGWEQAPRYLIGVIDETDRKEAFAAGAFAAQSALTGSGSVVLRYDRDRIEPLIVPLDRVADKTRHMPDVFLPAAIPFRMKDGAISGGCFPNGPISSCLSCENPGSRAFSA